MQRAQEGRLSILSSKHTICQVSQIIATMRLFVARECAGADRLLECFKAKGVQRSYFPAPQCDLLDLFAHLLRSCGVSYSVRTL